MEVEAIVERARVEADEPVRSSWWLRATPRRAVLIALALVPLLTPVLSPKDDAPFIYPYCAVTLMLSGWFCWQASRLYPAEAVRWQTVAIAQCIHAFAYVVTAMNDVNWIVYMRGAWLANACVSVSWVLFLPALMAVRSVRGRSVRLLDYALAMVTAALMMKAMGSGRLPGEGFPRVIVIMLVVVFMAVAGLVARLAASRPGLRLFSSVMSSYLAVCLVSYFLLNIVNLYWVKEPYVLASDVIISIPELLLCEWAVGWKVVPAPRTGGLTPALLDSLQPSMMALGGVLLALFGFRSHIGFASCAVIVIVVCYAVRTQVFYHRLFAQETELRTQASQMQALATRDPLTGVGNRRWFDEETEKLLAAGRSFPCTLVLVDTDKFKEVNDNFGHPLGDEVLRVVAEALSLVTAEVKRGCCARIGGDEFGAMWPGTTADQAMAMAEVIRAKVEATDFQAPVHATVSLGIATTQQPVPLVKLMRWADSALYRAKDAGRNAVRGIDLKMLRDASVGEEELDGE